MTGDTTLTVSVIVLIIGVVLNIYGFFSNRKKDIKTEAQELWDMKESLTKINLKTDQISNSLNEMRIDLRSMNDRLTGIEKDIVALKQRVTILEKIKGGIVNE